LRSQGGVYVTGEVVPSGDDRLPFKILFMCEDTVISEWLVKSKRAGEIQIVKGLKRLAEEMVEGEEEAYEPTDAKVSGCDKPPAT
jgi:hypothetical protein